MRLLAIDPGPENSSGVEYDVRTGEPVWRSTWPNDEWLIWLNDTYATDLAIEMVASYGMAVGADVFETVFWIGRFADRWETGPRLATGIPARRSAMLVYRCDVKLHLCGSSRAKDANVRQALIDRYGPGKEKAVGLKASPGPLYGISGHCWQALGVAVTAAETRLAEAA